MPKPHQPGPCAVATLSPPHSPPPPAHRRTCAPPSAWSPGRRGSAAPRGAPTSRLTSNRARDCCGLQTGVELPADVPEEHACIQVAREVLSAMLKPRPSPVAVVEHAPRHRNAGQDACRHKEGGWEPWMYLSLIERPRSAWLACLDCCRWPRMCSNPPPLHPRTQPEQVCVERGGGLGAGLDPGAQDDDQGGPGEGRKEAGLLGMKVCVPCHAGARLQVRLPQCTASPSLPVLPVGPPVTHPPADR